jgi:hypothetical protein
MRMSEVRVYKKVKDALEAFYREERLLLDVNASERSISHKLAEHLQDQFRRLNVDCEYNRYGTDIKRLQFPGDSSSGMDDLEAKTVFPDIIVHERGHDDNNLLVIEIKKSTSRQNHNYDYEKLKAFTTSPYRYRHGVFLLFDVEEKRLSDVRYFKSGSEMNDEGWIDLLELGCGV